MEYSGIGECQESDTSFYRENRCLSLVLKRATPAAFDKVV